jgi:fido (protein-threonine AMPylation protein)
MTESTQYVKFMVDIIESGVWSRLSSGAKTLYPVLLKFSDQNFKQVWPSTNTLMKLTGFKTKKSIQDAKKDLIQAGLLQIKIGKGHSNSVYYFTFNYEGSRIIPRWDKNIPREGIQKYPSEEEKHNSQGTTSVSPNHINITITNNQNQEPTRTNLEIPKEFSKFEELKNNYGDKIYMKSFEIAKEKNLENNYAYLRAICKNLFEQESIKAKEKESAGSWRAFLVWSQKHLTSSSYQILKDIEVEIEDGKLIINGHLSDFLKQIVQKYFSDNNPALELFFVPSENRICLN